MEQFNKNDWLEKTSEYMDYIEQHVKNVIAAWEELKEALVGVSLIQRPEILDEMDWRVRRHDASKMSEEEFLPYRQHFYPIEGEISDEARFDGAWRCHYSRNDHHWQYWVDSNGNFISYGSVDTKLCAYLEMICDWQAMGYIFGDSAPEYYKNHKDKIKIDPNWLPFVEEVLDSLEIYLKNKVVTQ